MIEIMIVIGILGLLMAVVIPNYLSHERRRALEGARDEAASLLGYARQVSVERGGAVVTLNGTPTTITVTQSGAGILKTLKIPPGITVTPPSGQTSFTYAANGTPSAGGQFTFTASDRSSVTLTLDASTGAVIR